MEYKWKNLTSTVTYYAEKIAQRHSAQEIVSEINRIEAGHAADAMPYNLNATGTTSSTVWWGNTAVTGDNFQSEYTRKLNELRKGGYEEYYIINKEDEMEMPFYFVCLSNGQVVDKAKEEVDAKRKATTYSAANKCDTYVMKAVSRFQPKDVPVEEVTL